jgi:hypothetical protein
MKSSIKIGMIIFVIILIVTAPYMLALVNNNKSTVTAEEDTVSPTLSVTTTDAKGHPGESVQIFASFNDNIEVATAKIYYKPASAIRWSSKSIITGNATLDIPYDITEDWFYYVIVDDSAGNGPVGDPSVDGSTYYIISVTSNNTQSNNNTQDQGDTGGDQQDQNTTTRHVFIEVGTRIVCSECPKIAALLDQMYKSVTFPFYYVNLPSTATLATDRLKQYDIYGYPTLYFDGGYRVLISSSVQKTNIAQAISDALARPAPKISLNLQANRTNGSHEFTVMITLQNEEPTNYQGHLRVYLTEIVSTSGDSNTPQRFLFNKFILDDDVEVQALGQKQFTKTDSLGSLDPENIMIFAAVFNSEKQTGYSQPPDKNAFEAHYVDAVATSRIIPGGNIPPAVSIQNPQFDYVHRFGNPVRKSLLGKTIIVGHVTVVANVTDDSAITKVEFYINGNLMKSVEKPPFSWTWSKFTIGKRTITVKAYDDKGKSSSASINVIVFMKWKGLLQIASL